MYRATQDTAGQAQVQLRGFHSLWRVFQTLHFLSPVPSAVLQPQQVMPAGLGCFPFARRYLGNHYLFSFPPATKMFQFAGFALTRLWIQRAVRRVAPFGDLWIKVCCQLPRAYRR